MYTPAPRDPKQPPVRINLLSDTQTRPTAGHARGDGAG
jgi:threonine aldolase